MLFTLRWNPLSQEKLMSNAAEDERCGAPGWAGDRPAFFERRWHPGWIVLTVLGFIVWWPIGLALLFFSLGSRRMACWSHQDRWSNKMERIRKRMERRGFGFSGFGPPPSGNRAFDEYRMETLRRLEEEQTEFKEFLERLRHAKDKEEFDQFMAQHRQRPTPPPDGQPQA